MLSGGIVVGSRYRVVRPLGGGGMKQVYLTEDSRLANRLCALAEMIENLAGSAEQQAATQAFAREAEMLARLDHPRIPHVFDHFSEQNRHYLVMQYVQGETLEQRLTKFPGGLDEQTVIGIGLQVLEALEYLHSRTPPVVFRDLKPSNLIIAPDGLVKLIDFGIARHFQSKKTATMVGTQGYAPPEQYEGKAEPRSDLYALGATLFQSLAGWDPTAHSPFGFPPLRQLRPDCNGALAELIEEALMTDLSQRIPSAAEFRNRLQWLKSGPQPAAVPPFVVQPAPAAVQPVAPGPARCPRCARTIPPDASLCPHCGAGLMQPSSAKQEKTALMSSELRPSRVGRHLIAVVVAAVLLGAVGVGIKYLREQRELAEAIHYSDQLFDQVKRCRINPSCKVDALLSATRDGMIKLAANSGDAEAEWILGKASLYKMHYDQALNWFRRAAEQGNPDGEVDLGMMYYIRALHHHPGAAEGVAHDYAEALNWLRKAAEQGNGDGEVALGYIYESGEGVAQDYVEALKWRRKAAEQGNAYGEVLLGSMYARGEGVAKDYSEALNWYRKAAEQGNAYGEFDLGGMYERGEGGVAKDYAEALIWYLKAAEQANADGEVALGSMYERGKGVAQNYGEALNWVRKAAEQGNADGEFRLGFMYETGQGVAKDYAAALKWFRKAAEEGNTDGEINLGFAYESGEGVAQDYAEALKWFRKAAEQGSGWAEVFLGSMYERGEGISRDYAQALNWFRKAAEQGNVMGQLSLGFMYETGEGLAKDYSEALKWYRKAAEQGNPHGEYDLGTMYENGKGIAPSCAQALKWFHKAAAQGMADAAVAIRQLHARPFCR